MTRPAARGDAPLLDQKSAFLEFLRHNRNVSPNTVRAYDTDLAQFLDHLAGRHTRRRSELTLQHFDTDGVRGFLEELHERGLSRSSAARRLAALRTFAGFLIHDEQLDADPTALVGSPRR